MEERSKEQKQARMMDQSSTVTDLPLHILMEIISRLPIKSVMAIRCVCKSLLSLVSDSHFQMLHSTRAPTELMLSRTGKSSTTLCIAEYVFVNDSLTPVDANNNVVFRVIDDPNFSVISENYCNFEATQTKVRLVNSCRGLVCFRGTSGNMFAVICNPFTCEYITLPCPASTDNTIETRGICYGLGFSPKDNSFKLLRLRKQVGTGYEKSRIVGEIYTFGEGVSSWKRVANCPDVSLDEIGLREVIFHEGALHWYCTYEDVIVTFDLDTELFGKLVTPPLMGEFLCSFDVRWSLAIGVFENCLYISGCVGDYVDIWALKEYGQASWVKIFSFQKDVNRFRERYEPFKYLQNGQVLMFKDRAVIVCFNPNTASVENVGVFCSRDGAVFIRPSLVSLKVLLGDNVKVHSVEQWDPMKAATDPTTSENTDSQGCMAGSSTPRSSSEASTSTSHPTEVKAKEDVLPTILASQQGSTDVGSFGSQDLRLLKDRRVDQSTSGTQKLVDEIETLKAENERKGKAIETQNVEIDRMGKTISKLGKVITKLKQGKKKDRSFMYQQMLNANPNMPALPMPDDSNSSDDSD